MGEMDRRGLRRRRRRFEGGTDGSEGRRRVGEECLGLVWIVPSANVVVVTVVTDDVVVREDYGPVLPLTFPPSVSEEGTATVEG